MNIFFKSEKSFTYIYKLCKYKNNEQTKIHTSKQIFYPAQEKKKQQLYLYEKNLNKNKRGRIIKKAFQKAIFYRFKVF